MISRLIALLFTLSLSSIAFSEVQEIPDSSAVNGIGKIFEITSSELNVTVESSNDVYAYVQSNPQKISINVAKVSPEIISTTLTIKNLAPDTKYNLTKNEITEEITSDYTGVIIYDVDLEQPQTIILTTN